MQWCQSDEEDANVPQVEPEKLDLKFGDGDFGDQVEPEKLDLKFGDGDFGDFTGCGGEKCWILFQGDAAPVPLDSLTTEQEFKLENGSPFQYVPPPRQVPVGVNDDNGNGMGSSNDVCPGASMERAKRKEVGVVEADRLMKKRTLLLGETSTDDEGVTLPPTHNLKPASKKAKGSSNPAKRRTPKTGPIKKKLSSKMVRDGSCSHSPSEKLPDVNTGEDGRASGHADGLPDVNVDASRTSPTEKLPDANMVGDGSSHSPSEKLPDVNMVEDGMASGHVDELPDAKMVKDTSRTSPVQKLPNANMVGDGSSHSPSEKLLDVNTVEDGRASGHADGLPDVNVDASRTSPTEKLPDANMVGDGSSHSPSEKLPDVNTVEDGRASGHADGLPDANGVEEDPQDLETEKAKKAAKRQDYRANKQKEGFELLRKTSIQDLKIAKDFAQASLVSTSSL